VKVVAVYCCVCSVFVDGRDHLEKQPLNRSRSIAVVVVDIDY